MPKLTGGSQPTGRREADRPSSTQIRGAARQRVGNDHADTTAGAPGHGRVSAHMQPHSKKKDCGMERRESIRGARTHDARGVGSYGAGRCVRTKRRESPHEASRYGICTGTAQESLDETCAVSKTLIDCDASSAYLQRCHASSCACSRPCVFACASHAKKVGRHQSACGKRQKGV
eukprot:5772992-Pleurochrysis_carterae.AAC.1